MALSCAKRHLDRSFSSFVHRRFDLFHTRKTDLLLRLLSTSTLREPEESIADHDPLKSKVHLRLMPIGGSVTYGSGSTDGNGYRNFLRQMLVSEGYKVDMVGSRKAGAMEDNDNEGWRGFRIDQIMSKLQKSVPSHKPNIFTINAGSNDCVQDYNIGSAGQRMANLLEYLWSASPGSTIILSTLIVNACEMTEQRVVRINEQLELLAKDMIAAGRKLVVVDMHGTDGPCCDDLPDGTHPNDVGYEKMARIWFQGIRYAVSRNFL